MWIPETWKGLAILVASVLLAAPAAASEEVPDTLLAALPPQSQANEKLVFDVLMDGRKIGSHAVTLWRDGPRTHVDIDINLRVGLGPITLYRYEQRNRSLWDNGALTAFESRTNDDGDVFVVRASRLAGRRDNALTVAVNDGAPVAVSDWFPTTYWDKRTVLQDRLLATRDGEILNVDTTAMGVEMIEVRGVPTRAERFQMRGDLNVDLWYDDDGGWVKLAFDYRGNRFDYVLR